MFEELRSALASSNNCDVIIYIHGFANDFVNTAKRAAALQELYGEGGSKAIVVMFSWPSNGRVFPAWQYFSDRDDAQASGLAMARALEKLIDFLRDMMRRDRGRMVIAEREGRELTREDFEHCGQRLHIVAHSMGGWALRHAVNSYAEKHPGPLPGIFDKVFLMAADADADALSRQDKLGPLLQMSNEIHVYHARDDLALEVSYNTKGNPKRLGTNGPDDIDDLPRNVIGIDCQDVSDTTASHGRHQYYRLREEVIKDVKLTLADAAQEDRPGRKVITPMRRYRLKDSG
ncbi:MAG: alpha/beta fold hydrolase [Pseudomonadota bacterium]